MLEIFERRPELFECLIVGIFFENVMKESETDDKFLAVLLSQLTRLFKFSYHFGKIMMPAEIKVHYFFYFTINHLGDIEMVRFLLFVHNRLFYCLLFVVKRLDTGVGFMDKCKKI